MNNQKQSTEPVGSSGWFDMVSSWWLKLFSTENFLPFLSVLREGIVRRLLIARLHFSKLGITLRYLPVHIRYRLRMVLLHLKHLTFQIKIFRYHFGVLRL